MSEPVTVKDLRPGDRLEPHATLAMAFRPATFIAAVDHPLYEGLALVIWRQDDGTWQPNALSWHQEVDPYVGTVDVATTENRDQRLRDIFLPGVTDA